MARRPEKKKLPPGSVELTIVSLTHDGRGVARLNGKTQFVEGALVGETVRATYTGTRSKFDELKTQKVLVASEDRIPPPCKHAKICGGCSLQHIDAVAQINFKQSVLHKQLQHFGDIKADSLLDPITGPEIGYRRKARLGVSYNAKIDELIVGFREKNSDKITGIKQCMVLDERIGNKIAALQTLIRSLSVYRVLPQIEVAAGDSEVALIFTHLKPLTHKDTEKLIAFGEEHHFHIYLQPKGPDSVHRIHPQNADGGLEESVENRLSYVLDEFDLRLKFHPSDFTQVNADINKQMVSRAIAWLDLNADDRVLDLFCGLGNFTLPLARRAGEVVGIEGDDAMVVRGRENAEHNRLHNVRFYGADLQADFAGFRRELQVRVPDRHPQGRAQGPNAPLPIGSRIG